MTKIAHRASAAECRTPGRGGCGAPPDRVRRRLGAFQVCFGTGIDGIFTDNPDTGLPAREDFVNG